jgi:TolB protein
MQFRLWAASGVGVIAGLMALDWGADAPLLRAAQDPIKLEARRSDAEPVPASLVRLELEGLTNEDANVIRAVLEADLRRSLVFRVMRPPALPELASIASPAPTTELIKAVGAEGIDSVVWLKASKKSKDVVLEARVFDGGTGQMVLGKRYVGDVSILRTVVHRLADEMVYRYTGEKGIAQTRIVFFSSLTGNKEL